MSIYKSAVNKPITTIMVFVAIIVLGLFSLSRLPIDLYPEINPPYISVMTTYSGANSQDVELNVTRRIEDALNSVDKLKEITSVSYDNLSIVNLQFEWDANLDEAVNDIRDAIDRIYRYLPDGCDRPAIFKFSTSMMPIIFYAITAKESYPGLAKILDEKIVNPLNRIDGVGSVGLVGAPKRKIYVDIDPVKMDAYNLTVEQIGNRIMTENINMPAGSIRMGKLDYQLRIEGEFTESNQLNNILLTQYNGKPIYLKDVANVRDTIKELTLEEKINGSEGMRLFVMKQSGANTVKVAREVRKQINQLKKTLPPDIHIQEILDTSSFIKGSIKNLSETLMYAFIFVVLVILMFLGRWRATFIIIITIPISLIVAFIFLYLKGSSINIISLSSLSIAIGMVVDDAIVVLENIARHIDRGSEPREAAIYATNEVWLAVIATTLVILAVFMPLTLVKGFTGVMFRELGWLVSITVSTSTLTAITLTPMLSSRILKLRQKDVMHRFQKYVDFTDKFMGKIEDIYEKILSIALHNKRKFFWGMMVLFIASIFLLKFIGKDFMPESDESRIQANIELQSGIRVEETTKITRKIEKIIKERYPEVVVFSTSTGADDEGGLFSLFNQTGSNIINLIMRLKNIDERSRTVWEIAEDLRNQLKSIPEIASFNVTTSGTAFMGGASNTVNVEIYGYNIDTTTAIARKIKERIEKLPGARDVQISRKNEKPALKIEFDKEKLALHGLNTATVASYVRNRIEGMRASLFREEGDEYDIIVRYSKNFRSSVTDLEQITIITPQGKKIKLKEIAEVKEYWAPPSIERKRRERVVTVSVKPVGVPLSQLAQGINEELKKIKVPEEVMINVGGAYEDQMESFRDLALLFILSLLLVYIVMASQFESFVMPFIIMFSVPFALTGVFLALFITKTTLSLIAGLGTILLIGIVVKNGIVLVDFINLMRERGLELFEAIEAAGKSRLRPVLMTALTTILGMLPLALSTGEGSELWRPLGVTVVGGLTVSTFITLVIIPVAYAIFARRSVHDRKMTLRKKFHFLD